MEGVVDLAQNVFRTSSVRLGCPENLGGIEENYRKPSFATVIGLVLASKNMPRGNQSRKKHGERKEKSKNGDSVLKKIFKSLF